MERAAFAYFLYFILMSLAWPGGRERELRVGQWWKFQIFSSLSGIEEVLQIVPCRWMVEFVFLFERLVIRLASDISGYSRLDDETGNSDGWNHQFKASQTVEFVSWNWATALKMINLYEGIEIRSAFEKTLFFPFDCWGVARYSYLKSHSLIRRPKESRMRNFNPYSLKANRILYVNV